MTQHLLSRVLKHSISVGVQQGERKGLGIPVMHIYFEIKCNELTHIQIFLF